MKRNAISSVTFVLTAARIVPRENTATDTPRLSFRPHLSAIVESANAPMMYPIRLLVTDRVTVAFDTWNCVAITGVANEIVTMSKKAKK
jgi:hypothetical protein